MSIILAEREKGSVPISIGTALAIEGALGTYPDRPPVSPAPLLKYKQVWFNLHTLFRNLTGTVTAEQRNALFPADVVPALAEDMLGAASAIEAASRGQVSAMFYVTEYRSLARKFPHAHLKMPSTPAQQAFTELQQQTLRQLLKDPPVAVKRFDVTLEGTHPKSLIVTHYPVDLLSRYHFESLDLLESHSGNIKKPSQWNTKLGIKDGRERLPFNAFTLQVFGDNGVMFKPLPLALRRRILEIAEANHWSSVTTLDKIKANIEATRAQDTIVAFKPYLS